MNETIARECVDALMGVKPERMTAKQAFKFLSDEWKNTKYKNSYGYPYVISNERAVCVCMAITIMCYTKEMISSSVGVQMKKLVWQYRQQNKVLDSYYFPRNAVGSLYRAAMCLELAEKADG